MSYDPRAGYPRVVSVLAYEDVAAAIDWLSSALGFRGAGPSRRASSGSGGHRWELSQFLRDVRPEDWGATPAPLSGEAAR